MSEYTRKINRGFQLTIPQSFRDAYKLQIGDYLRIHEEDGKLIIEPIKMVSKNLTAAMEELFESLDNNFDDLPEEEIMALVRHEIRKSRK